MSFKFRLGIFLAVCLFAALSVPFPHLVLWLLGAYPVPAGTPPTYQLLSGFIPAAAVIGVIWPFLNCTVSTCMRYGRYHVDGLRVCYEHHPDENITRSGVSHEHILRVHHRNKS